MNKFKDHIKRHKMVYIAVGTGVVVAGITVVIMRKNVVLHLDAGANGPLQATTRSDAKPTYWAHRPMQSPPTGHIGSSFFSKPSMNIVSVIEREGRGHPGYLTEWVEEDLIYKSQKQAALNHGVHPNRMSDHINGRLESLDGKHFKRVKNTPEGVAS